MRALRIAGIALGLLLLVAAGVAIAARFSDGPIGPFAGGPFDREPVGSGADVDWWFVDGVDTVDFQLLEPPRSRKVWILRDGNEIYIPCGVPQFTLWKQWPHEALADGRILLQVGTNLYSRQLVKIEDRELHARLSEQIEEKYGAPRSDFDSVWIFRVDPRES